MTKRIDGYLRALENGTLSEYHDKQDKSKKKCQCPWANCGNCCTSPKRRIGG